MILTKCLVASIAVALTPVYVATIASPEEPSGVEDEELDENADSAEFDEDAFDAFIATDTVRGVSGAEVPVGGESHAVVRVPASMRFVNADDTRRLLELYWGNPADSAVLGAIVPATDTIMDNVEIAYILYYDGSGHVDDSDAESTDFDAMLKDLQEQTAEDSKKLAEMGFPAQELVGWAKDPEYDSEHKILRWAKHMRFTYGDGSYNNILNYCVRVLGRHGSVDVLAVADMADAESVIARGDSLSSLITFADGYTYSDFNSLTDNVSDYTIGALVAGSILSKTGILAKIGLFLLKAWKIILVALAAIGALIAKIVKGRKKGEGDKPEDKAEPQA